MTDALTGRRIRSPVRASSAWAEKDSNLRRQNRQIYSLLPLAARAPTTFDVVSEVDMQEVRNAVDQANREATTRFDFKGTDSTIELNDKELLLASSTEDRLRALYQVLQEKMVKREVSLKSFDVGKVEEASKGTARQRLGIQAGISSDHAKKINRFVKDLNLKGVSSQTQGDQLRVTGKKRDDLQAVITALKAEDFGIPLQFNNFRD